MAPDAVFDSVAGFSSMSAIPMNSSQSDLSEKRRELA